MTQLTTETIDGRVERVLQEDDPELLSDLRERRREQLELLYPEPELADIQREKTDLEADFSTYHELVNENRDLRYQRDTLPEKWQQHLKDGRRVRTRLTHNEIMRVVASQTRNPPRVHYDPAGSGPKARERAEKRSRWMDELLPTFERLSPRPLRRRYSDAQASDGLGVVELVLTDAYEKLDTSKRRTVTNPETGDEEEESDKAYLERTEEELKAAGFPLRLRHRDCLSVLWREDDEGVCKLLFTERKAYREVYAELRKTKSQEQLAQLRLPRPADPGTPAAATAPQELRGEVECITYYDRRWYAYVVEGRIADGPREHKMPGVPAFLFHGMVTSSPNMSEMLQGVTWGMSGIELALNDLLTLGTDTAFAYSKPRIAVKTPADGRLLMGQDKKPRVLDFSDPSRVEQLNPGQEITDATAGFKPNLPRDVMDTLMGLWQRSGLNPIAQGESPGADPAGYTVNSLMGAAQAMYEVLLDNEARTWGRICDFVGLVIRDTLQEAVYLSVPVSEQGRRGQRREWLRLGPEDIDDTNAIVTIDPLSDANRLAIRQSLTQGYKDKIVPRREVQEKGYGAEDADAWDEEIIEDAAIDQLSALLIEVAKQRVFGIASPPPEQQVIYGPKGEVISGAPGATPAPPNPSTVGPGASEASRAFERGQGPRALAPARALAGQGQGARVQAREAG